MSHRKVYNIHIYNILKKKIENFVLLRYGNLKKM